MNCPTVIPPDMLADLAIILFIALIVAIGGVAATIEKDPGPPPPGFPRH